LQAAQAPKPLERCWNCRERFRADKYLSFVEIGIGEAHGQVRDGAGPRGCCEVWQHCGVHSAWVNFFAAGDVLCRCATLQGRVGAHAIACREMARQSGISISRLLISVSVAF
jgi:hypothetical protein